jgi:hypothetical protein
MQISEMINNFSSVTLDSLYSRSVLNNAYTVGGKDKEYV